MLYGVAVSFLFATIALYSVDYVPVDMITLSLILGIIFRTLTPSKHNQLLGPGLSFSSKRILEIAIALMGFKLSLSYLKGLGVTVILFSLLLIGATLFLAPLIGKIFKLDHKGAMLTGVGNAVCGASAIATINPIWKASPAQMAMSIAVINFLGTIGMFILPIISKLSTLTPTESAYLIGGTLQAVGQVAASSFALGDQVGEMAIVIKMFRVLMIVPLIIIFSFIMREKSEEKNRFELPKLPPFILFFLFASIIATEYGPHPIFVDALAISKFLLAVAMFGIGTTISFSTIKKEGAPMLYMGTALFIIQLIIAFSFIKLVPLV